jgi:hypothetical protein
MGSLSVSCIRIPRKKGEHGTSRKYKVVRSWARVWLSIGIGLRQCAPFHMHLYSSTTSVWHVAQTHHLSSSLIDTAVRVEGRILQEICCRNDH